ncbi:DNA recombination protein RmuC [soil metagenome]
MDVSTLVLTVLLALSAGLALGLWVGVGLGTGVLRRARAGTADQLSANLQATASVVTPVKDSLDRFDGRLHSLESSGVAWQERLAAQVEAVRLTGEALRRETGSLSTALRRPQVRGQWGEMQLRRAVELAGMVQHCDFTLQTSVRTDDGVRRPDLLVRLAGGRNVVVDAKVPLDAFLRATDAAADGDDDNHDQQLAHHGRQMRAHIDALAAKAYWRQFAPTPEFVVMFVPGEAFLSQALAADPGLLEYAATRKVVPATPTTLIALLRTVSYAWTQESLADSAREVQDAARELYERLGTMGAHVDKLGRSLTAAVGAYNSTVGALEGRVLVSARRLHDLHVGDDEPAAPAPVERATRPLSATELVVDRGHGDDFGDRDISGGRSAARDVPARRTG